MYTIRPAGPGKGLGVFATRLIPRGTRILSERALLTLPSTENGESRPRDLFEAFERLDRRGRDRVEELSGWEGEGIGWAGRWGSALRWGTRRRDGGGDGLGCEGGGMGLWGRIKRNKRVLDIWRSNSFGIGHADSSAVLVAAVGSRLRGGDKTEGKEGLGEKEKEGGGGVLAKSMLHFHLFPTIARLNHSCVPNAQANFLPSAFSSSSTAISTPSSTSTPAPTPCTHTHGHIPASPGPQSSSIETQPQQQPQPQPQGTFNIHALTDIPPNTEIHISYLPEHGALRPARQAKLRSGYGFLCACPACSSTPSALRAEEERRIMQGKLAQFACMQKSSGDQEEEGEGVQWYYDAEGNREMVPPSTSSTSLPSLPSSSSVPSPSSSPSAEAQSTNSPIPEKITEADTELDLTKSYLRMLESQNISGREVATTYYRIARLLLERETTGVDTEEGETREAGLQEALSHAECGLKIDEVCLGRDHPVYAESAAFVASLRS